MATTTNPVPREGPRDDTIRLQRWLRADALPIVKAWWLKQARETRTGLVVAALLALASTFSLCASLSRPATLPASINAAPRAVANNAPPLVREASAPDTGKVWVATKTWQGAGAKDTEMFTVTGHWRVDWIFSPTSPAGAFQVFIYAADGLTLMQIAASNKDGGSDTSFWAGPGTYFLRINSSGGDWKVGVQDLH